jgi:hypothetical protein
MGGEGGLNKPAARAEQGADFVHVAAAEAVIIGIAGACGFSSIGARPGGMDPRAVFPAVFRLPGALFFGPGSHRTY